MTSGGEVFEEMYKEELLEHWRHPQNKGMLSDFDLEAHAYNQLCGDRLLLRIKLTDGVVAKVSFDGEGCAISQGAASILSEALKEKELSRLKSLTEKEVLELLGIKIIPSRLKCALLPLQAVRSSLL